MSRDLIESRRDEFTKKHVGKGYMLPPDPRTLFMKSQHGVLVKPTDEGKHVKNVWWLACKEFALMSELEKSAWLRITKKQHWLDFLRKDRNEGLPHGQNEDKFMLRLFKRFMVWEEYVAWLKGEEDEQPSRAELAAFFTRPEVRENGASLVDVCHFFPGAKDMKMLVWRLEQVADLEGRPEFWDGEKTWVGENVYVPVGEEEVLARAAAFASSAAAAAVGSSKRKRSFGEDDNDAEQQQRPKKAKVEEEEVTGSLPLMKCSGRTKKGKACQMKKRARLPVGQRWNCGRHGRGEAHMGA